MSNVLPESMSRLLLASELIKGVEDVKNESRVHEEGGKISSSRRQQ